MENFGDFKEFDQEEMNLTGNSLDIFFGVVDDEKFRNDDEAKMIYHTLRKQLKPTSFAVYLKRYIYNHNREKFPNQFVDTEIKEYQKVLYDAFAENETDWFFDQTTTKRSQLTKHWLTQASVNRKVVFLLGFGLKMTVEEVNEFLNKALCEREINPKDPFEVICRYCYEHNRSFADFKVLWERYQNAPKDGIDVKFPGGDNTINMRRIAASLKGDDALIAHTATLKANQTASQFSVTAKKRFDKLYDEARDLVAKQRNSDMDTVKEYTSEKITAGDLEKVICAAIPINRKGNLTEARASTLNALFSGKRFSRQRIADILQNKAPVTRFDLITLNFFIFSQKLEEYPNAQTRFYQFCDSTNEILNECFLGNLYPQNPYECFVLMCILSEDPLVTYADVWELSFRKESEGTTEDGV